MQKWVQPRLYFPSPIVCLRIYVLHKDLVCVSVFICLIRFVVVELAALCEKQADLLKADANARYRCPLSVFVSFCLCSYDQVIELDLSKVEVL